MSGRSSVPLVQLAMDPDPQYRPSPDLLSWMSTVWVARGLPGEALGDRATIPLLNALVAAGLRPWECTAESSITLHGHSRREREALMRFASALPVHSVVVGSAEASRPRGSVAMHWGTEDAAALSPEDIDRRLLAAAGLVGSAPLTTSDQRTPEGEWLDHLVDRVRSVVPNPASVLRVELTDSATAMKVDAVLVNPPGVGAIATAHDLDSLMKSAEVWMAKAEQRVNLRGMPPAPGSGPAAAPRAAAPQTHIGG
jgi:hypothetical protein